METSPSNNQPHQFPVNEAVVFIEFQNEWVNEQGWLRRNLIEGDVDFPLVLIKAKKLIKLARKTSANIIHVTLRPDREYRLFGKAKYGLRATIAEAGTWKGDMQDIHVDFKPQENELVINERTNGCKCFCREYAG